MQTYRLFLIPFLLPCMSLQANQPGSVVFLHPAGSGLGHWNAARHFYAGPDGMLNWDKMERLAACRVHQKNWLSTTSHAGATAHAYGRKVHYESFGLDRNQPVTALSGKQMTILEEAMAAGFRGGIINSGSIGEAGTAVFLSRSEERHAVADIAAQIFSSDIDLIFCGGEIHLIPEGTTGFHGAEGVRDDGRDLLSEARAKGYTVVFTREELLKLPTETGKVIGIFAAGSTYSVRNEAALKAAGLETYDPRAPTCAEMVEVALRILGSDPTRDFMLVSEEKGVDNFSNQMNAKGMLDAMGRADDAIGEVMDYMQEHAYREILLLVAADSDAGHPGIWSPKNWDADFRLPVISGSGAQIDGPGGEGGVPFWSKPDRFANRYPFGIAWGTSRDMPGSAVAKAHGYRSDLLQSTVDNTDIYRILHAVMFGK
jgi:alkaline phosphatase